MEQWLISTIWGVIILGTIGGVLAYILIQISKRISERVKNKLIHSVRPFLYKKLEKYENKLKVYLKDDMKFYTDKFILIETMHNGIKLISFLIAFFANVILTVLSHTLLPENYMIKIFFLASVVLFGLLFLGTHAQYFYIPLLYKKIIKESNSKTDNNKKVEN